MVFIFYFYKNDEVRGGITLLFSSFQTALHYILDFCYIPIQSFTLVRAL